MLQIGFICGVFTLTFLPVLFLNVFESKLTFFQNILYELTILMLAYSLFFFELVLKTEDSAIRSGRILVLIFSIIQVCGGFLSTI